MKTATYINLDGTRREVEYDENALCIYCNKPVISASMGGTLVCPWCDMGVDRDTGASLTWAQTVKHKENYERRMAESEHFRSIGFFWKDVRIT